MTPFTVNVTQLNRSLMEQPVFDPSKPRTPGREYLRAIIGHGDLRKAYESEEFDDKDPDSRLRAASTAVDSILYMAGQKLESDEHGPHACPDNVCMGNGLAYNEDRTKVELVCRNPHCTDHARRIHDACREARFIVTGGGLLGDQIGFLPSPDIEDDLGELDLTKACSIDNPECESCS